MQTALAYAQKKGLMSRTGDVFTGTSVEAFRHAFQRFDPTAASHTVAADIGATGEVASHYLDLIGRLRTDQDLTPAQQRALAYHENLQPRLYRENVRQHFLRSRQDLLTAGHYEYYADRGQQLRTDDFQKILDIHQGRQQTYGYGHDLAALHQEIAGLSPGEVEAAMAAAHQDRERIFQEAWAETQSAAFRRCTQAGYDKFTAPLKKSYDALRSRPFLGLAAGLGLAMTGLALLPGKKEDHNTIEGLQHGWFGERSREHTDFGSGYQGPERSQEVNESVQEEGRLGRILDWSWEHKGFLATVGALGAIGVLDVMGRRRLSWLYRAGQGWVGGWPQNFPVCPAC